jgi:hypothetical protein
MIITSKSPLAQYSVIISLNFHNGNGVYEYVTFWICLQHYNKPSNECYKQTIWWPYTILHNIIQYYTILHHTICTKHKHTLLQLQTIHNTTTKIALSPIVIMSLNGSCHRETNETK